MVIRNGSPPHKFGGMAGREGQKDFGEGRRRRNGIWKADREGGGMDVGRKDEGGRRRRVLEGWKQEGGRKREFGGKRMLESCRQWDVGLNRRFGLMAEEGPNSHFI
jgi:hypothetical protein